MACDVIEIWPHGHAIVCGRGRHRRCSACGALGAEFECDFPMPRRKTGTCDAPLCRRCRVPKGENVDWCPRHVVEHEPEQVALL